MRHAFRPVPTAHVKGMILFDLFVETDLSENNRVLLERGATTATIVGIAPEEAMLMHFHT